MNKDLEHLKLLSLFHYILGGITAFFACFPLIHVAVGAMILFMPEQAMQHNRTNPFPQHLFGLFFIAIGGAFVICGWALAICMIMAGRYLKAQQKYTFCLVVGAISCLMMPLGTALGIFTIITLLKDSVKSLFMQPQAHSTFQNWQ
jgi:hypothetical protein